MEKCSFCSRTDGKMTKIKGKFLGSDYICEDCLSEYPECISDKVSRFTVKELEDFRKCWKLSKTDSRKLLVNLGRLGICKDCFHIDGIVIETKNIRSFRVAFVPQSVHSADYAYGFTKYHIELKEPKCELEFRCFGPEKQEMARASLRSDGSVEYAILDSFKKYADVISDMVKCGEEDNYRLLGYIMQEKDRKNNGSDTGRNSSSQNNSQRSSDDRSGNTSGSSEGGANGSQKSSGGNDEFNEALMLYGMSLPFTVSELKNRRNKLLQFYHPDNGGSDIMCTKVNVAFDLLEKYASK